jgi:hypothetical protein
MTDHIQPEPSRRPNPVPAAFEESTDPLVYELRRRIQGLEQEKRRWKVIGLAALFALLLVLVGGVVASVGTASLYAARLRESQLQAVMEAERAEMQAQEAQMQAERARLMFEAAKREAARQGEKGVN